VLAGVAGLGKSTDHELLTELDFQLKPVMGAVAGIIPGVNALRDDALPAFSARLREHFIPITFHRLRDTYLRRDPFFDSLHKSSATIGPGLSHQHFVAVHQDVEENERRGGGRSVSLDHVRLLDVHAALQLLEASGTPVD